MVFYNEADEISPTSIDGEYQFGIRAASIPQASLKSAELAVTGENYAGKRKTP